ncbi:MAG: hypothetical protein GXY53_06590 [Desulfobulbus sp.]|nr:hypothetical protein [Desulfobulbus sp.]
MPPVYRYELELDRELTVHSAAGRRIFMHLTRGSLTVNGTRMDGKDQKHIDIDRSLVLQTVRHADFVHIDLPEDTGEKQG